MAGDGSYGRHSMSSAAGVRGTRMQLDLGQLQDSFQLLISQADPDHLAAFFYWLDLKVAQFKVFGNGLAQGTDQYSAVKREGESTSATADSSSCPPVNGHGLYSTDHYADTPPPHDRNGMRYSDTPPPRDRNGLVPHEDSASLATSSSVVDHSIDNMPPLCSVHELASSIDELGKHRVAGGEVNAKHVVKSLLRAMLVKPSHGGATSSDVSELTAKSEFDSSSDETPDHGVSMADHSISMVSYNPVGSHDDDVGTDTDAVARDDETGRDNGVGGVGAAMESETESLLATSINMLSAGGGGGGELTVSPEKMSRCPYCLKVFRYRSSYRRHVKIHEGIFSHECSVCLRKFTRKEHYVRHKCDRRPNKPYNVTHEVYRRMTAQATAANQRLVGRHMTRPVRPNAVSRSPDHQVPLELTSQAVPPSSGGVSVPNLLFTGGTVCQSVPPAVRSMDTSYSLCSPLNITSTMHSGDEPGSAVDMSRDQRVDAVDMTSQPARSETLGEMSIESSHNHRVAELCNQHNNESRRKSSTPRKVVATASSSADTIENGTIEMSPSSLDASQRVNFLANGSSVPVSVID